ncbi:MAG: hypothetical protein R6V06_07140, partial [Kiritimatiellia bacterium]
MPYPRHGFRCPSGKKFQPAPEVLENRYLKISFEAAENSGRKKCFHVQDKRSSRIWKQQESGIEMSGLLFDSNSVAFDLSFSGSSRQYHGVITLAPDQAEFTVEFSAPADSKMSGKHYFPPAFLSEPGDRVVIPICEGISYPVETDDAPSGYRAYYRGHGVTMAFFGSMEEKIHSSGESTGGAAYMAICETPANSGVELLWLPSNNSAKENSLLTIRQGWVADKGYFGYSR